MLQNWLSSNKNVIATSENQITSDDNAMRDLGSYFLFGSMGSKFRHFLFLKTAFFDIS